MSENDIKELAEEPKEKKLGIYIFLIFFSVVVILVLICFALIGIELSGEPHPKISYENYWNETGVLNINERNDTDRLAFYLEDESGDRDYYLWSFNDTLKQKMIDAEGKLIALKYYIINYDCGSYTLIDTGIYDIEVLE